jgi:GT2 family glycosyltransferase
MVLSSIFGVGNAYFRFSKKERFVDTVAYGAYVRDIFDEIGLFDERLVRNQDIELNYRLKNKGHKLFLTPSIKVFYNCRADIWDFIKQYFRTGFWNINMLRISPNSLSWRHFIPVFFILVLGLGLLVAVFNFYGMIFSLVCLAIYFAFAFIFSLALAIEHGFIYFPLLPLSFFILHLSYGLGSLVGIFSLIKKDN